MGQLIDVSSTVVGGTAIFDTDRSITGQDGAEFRSAEAAGEGETFPHKLAQRLFATDSAIESVFVASNVVTVSRSGGWPDAAVAALSQEVRDFFLFYP